MSTLWAFYLDYFEPLRLRSRSASTKRLYRTTIKTFTRFLDRPAVLADLNDDTVGRYLSWFLGLPRSPYSANKEHSNLLAIWRYGCRRRENGAPLIADWPTVGREIEPEDDPLAWTEGDLKRLFTTLRNLPGYVGKVLACHWWMALHLVMWDTGERIGAVMQLANSDADLATGWLTVTAGKRKGRRQGRTYKLHPDTIVALETIRGDRKPEEPLFPFPHAANYLWNRYAVVLRRAGLPSDSKSKFHRMRRSFASHGERAGMNATEMLGHSSRKVTRRYLDPRLTTQAAPSDVLFRPKSD